MGREASEELSRDLQELHDNACHVEAYAGFLQKELSDLVAASARIRSLLNGNEGGDDTFQDHAREVMAMKYEIGRLAERVLLMRMDCERM
ncbi:hypothetical protein [Streptomyces sp. NBC_01373]|uniref:hypothetical protein n=1 Tax=Streptomyces sp. NBC_01373 TaxID=2903843 RepID=UPI00225877C4|nr:hypothetical protein [Streptomyces sp. NBC_01373]MCX4699009.1 hypothetical protein [Streptomyces sp. NBC_01373]